MTVAVMTEHPIIVGVGKYIYLSEGDNCFACIGRPSMKGPNPFFRAFCNDERLLKEFLVEHFPHAHAAQPACGTVNSHLDLKGFTGDDWVMLFLMADTSK